jgi:hypothetical protein
MIFQRTFRGFKGHDFKKETQLILSGPIVNSSVASPQVLRFELSWKGGERFKIWKDKYIYIYIYDEKDIDWFLNSIFKNKINYQWKKKNLKCE